MKLLLLIHYYTKRTVAFLTSFAVTSTKKCNSIQIQRLGTAVSVQSLWWDKKTEQIERPQQTNGGNTIWFCLNYMYSLLKRALFHRHFYVHTRGGHAINVPVLIALVDKKLSHTKFAVARMISNAFHSHHVLYDMR